MMAIFSPLLNPLVENRKATNARQSHSNQMPEKQTCDGIINPNISWQLLPEGWRRCKLLHSDPWVKCGFMWEMRFPTLGNKKKYWVTAIIHYTFIWTFTRTCKRMHLICDMPYQYHNQISTLQMVFSPTISGLINGSKKRSSISGHTKQKAIQK